MIQNLTTTPVVTTIDKYVQNWYIEMSVKPLQKPFEPLVGLDGPENLYHIERNG